MTAGHFQTDRVLQIFLVGIFACSLFIAATACAFEVQGLPGSTWGNVNHSTSGLTGSGGMGWVKQGIDWFIIPGDIVVNTFAEYRYRAREKQKTYYNSHGPVLGLELRKSYFTAGIEYYRERFPKLGETSRSRGFYGTWYYDWNVKSKKVRDLLGVRDLPGSTWGRLYKDINGLTGSGAMGWINQGVNWFTIPGNIIVNTYAEYRYRGRTKEKLYYNAHGPAVGLEFRKDFLRLGVSYYWEKFPELNERSNAAGYYLTWHYSWDLKK